MPHARGATLVATDIEVVLDSRGEPAAARLERLDAFTNWQTARVPRVVGNASDVVEAIRFLSASVDIVRLVRAVIDVDLPELRFKVLPASLQEGAALAPRTGATLRESLGLGIAVNRYATT